MRSPTRMRGDRVLIISDRDDVHARAVLFKLATVSGKDSAGVLFDTATFPMASDLALGSELRGALAVFPALPRMYGGGTSSILREPHDNKTLVRLEDIRSVYWRRPRPAVIDDALEHADLRRYAAKSSRETIEGWIERLSLSCIVVDAPTTVSRAGLKILQLELARRVGLSVPRTLVTNNPREAACFIDALCKSGVDAVSKSPADISDFAAQTELVHNSARDATQSIRLSPAVLQERITGGPDLRITVVGGRLFGMSQTPGPGFDEVDCRADAAPHQQAFQAPDRLRDQLLALQQALGLRFGAYDFKCDSAGTPYFLEVNPGGQWLFVEVATGQPIAEAFARYLWNGPGAEWMTSLPPLKSEDLDGLYPFSIAKEYESIRRTLEQQER